MKDLTKETLVSASIAAGLYTDSFLKGDINEAHFNLNGGTWYLNYLEKLYYLRLKVYTFINKKETKESMENSLRDVARFRYNCMQHPDYMFPPESDRLRELCACLLYTSPSPRDRTRSRMPSSA